MRFFTFKQLTGIEPDQKCPASVDFTAFLKILVIILVITIKKERKQTPPP